MRAVQLYSQASISITESSYFPVVFPVRCQTFHQANLRVVTVIVPEAKVAYYVISYCATTLDP